MTPDSHEISSHIDDTRMVHPGDRRPHADRPAAAAVDTREKELQALDEELDADLAEPEPRG